MAAVVVLNVTTPVVPLIFGAPLTSLALFSHIVVAPALNVALILITVGAVPGAPASDPPGLLQLRRPVITMLLMPAVPPTALVTLQPLAVELNESPTFFCTAAVRFGVNTISRCCRCS